MTYCVALQLNRGLVFMSDTRTNAGIDNISVYKKTITWEVPGERVVTLMTAGNLATTQALISLLNERFKDPEDRTQALLTEPSMFQCARLVGATLREVIDTYSGKGGMDASAFNATVILGGQIKGSEPRLFLIYPEGNFIETSQETPFLQIGEAKYGKPILVRAFDPEMSFEDATKLLLVSFDSTLKANLSVGLPLDLQTYEKDSLQKGTERRFEADDAAYLAISSGWGDALKSAFSSLPDIDIEKAD
ncbi:MAG: proteasome-type protease [Pseudomonadota bacterium]